MEQEIVEGGSDTARVKVCIDIHNTRQELECEDFHANVTMPGSARVLQPVSFLPSRNTNLIIITFTPTFTFNCFSMSMIWLMESNCMDVTKLPVKLPYIHLTIPCTRKFICKLHLRLLAYIRQAIK